MIVKLLFLLPLFVVGIICSWTDIKEAKIRNKWVGLGFAWMLVLYLSLIVYNCLCLHQPGNINYVKEMVVNGLVALVLGYLLWNLRFMAAGDAKLFALYAFLIPPEFYAKSHYAYFPSFVLLINIFIPLLFFLTAKAAAFAAGRSFHWLKGVGFDNIFSGESFRKLGKNLFKLLKMYLFFALIFVVLQTALKETTGSLGGLSRGGNSVYVFLLLFFIYRFAFRLVSKNKLLGLGIVLAGIGCAAYLIWGNEVQFLVNAVKLAVVFMTIIGGIYRLLGYYIEQKEVRKIGVQEMKEGMFLAARDLDEEIKKKIGGVGKNELSQEQIRLIEDFLKDKPNKELKIYKTFALAPFVFLGALITVFTSNSVVALGISAFQQLF